MARLTYSRGGFKRKMQMANKVSAFVFIEGKDSDPYFYGEICEPVFSRAGIGYEVVPAWRLAEEGGKEPLLAFHDYLGVTGSLLTTFQGKRFAVIFFLDKDLDDIFQSKRHSDHIVYTEHYTIENYLFAHGDLARAASAASSIERREFLATLGDGAMWRRTGAEAWKDWVTFCVFAQKHEVGCEYTYRRSESIINEPLDAAAEAGALQGHRATLQLRSGMGSPRFERALGVVSRLVDRIYRRGKHDQLFNGKWYVALMQAHIQRIAAGRPYNSHGLRNRIVGAVSSTIDFSAEWVEHFRAPIRNLVARL